MDAKELSACLEMGENVSTEFKRCGALPKSDVYETVCSFANRQGGNIFLGVDDHGTVLGIEGPRLLQVQRTIVNALNNPKLFNVPPSIEMETLDIEGKQVLRLWVPVSSMVIRFKGVAYDRLADADVKVTTDTQLAAMYVRKQGFYSERKVFPYLEKSDLKLDLLKRARTMAAAKRANHPWLEMDDDELLKSANLYLKDYERGVEGFTLAAALLLGKDDVISSIVPAYKTDAYVQLQDLDRYDDRIVVKTNLMDAYDQLLGFAQKHLPDRFYIEGTNSISVRDIIARELIVNTLIHREYTSAYPAKFVIDRDGIHTENACRPRFVGTLTPQRFNPYPKNPIIAEFFSNIGLAETLGSGTRNLFKYSLVYSGKAPVLTEDDIFRAHVFLPETHGEERRSQRDVDEVISLLLDAYGYVTTSIVSAAASVSEKTARRHISQMVSDGIIAAEGGGKNRRYVKQR